MQHGMDCCRTSTTSKASLLCCSVHTRLAKKNGIVLRAPAENLHRPSDLVIAPNNRVKLPVSGGLCQIATVFLERLSHNAEHEHAPDKQIGKYWLLGQSKCWWAVAFSLR